MSYGGFGELPVPQVVPEPYDYLWGGPGLAELHRVAVETAQAMLSGGGDVHTILAYAGDQGASVVIPADPLVAAVWPLNYAITAAHIVANTVIAEQRVKPGKDYKQASALAYDLAARVQDKLHNRKDPAPCAQNFQDAFEAWSAVSTTLRAYGTPTGWCERELRFNFGGDSVPCQPIAVCKMTTDSANKIQFVSAAEPPPGTVLSPPPASAAAPVPPPTHAQIAAAARQQVAAGESLDDMERTQELNELAAYIGSMVQERAWLDLALNVPQNAADLTVLAALKSRGVEPVEALDWVIGCNGDPDCFRQRMNLALGEADQRAQDNRAKVLVAVGALAAVALGVYFFRGRR